LAFLRFVTILENKRSQIEIVTVNNR